MKVSYLWSPSFSYSTISATDSILPFVGQGLMGTIDFRFGYEKISNGQWEGVLSSSPSYTQVINQAAVFVSYKGSYDARITFAIDQFQRPACHYQSSDI